MFRAALRQYLEAAAKRAVTDGALPDVPLPSVEVDVPRGRRHADYATNLPLALARTAGRPPREIAQAIVAALEIPPQQVARGGRAAPRRCRGDPATAGGAGGDRRRRFHQLLPGTRVAPRSAAAHLLGRR